MLHSIKYFFRRKYQQICRVLDFLPIIWNGFDFDYLYSVELFKHQLKRQADFLESDKAYTVEAKNNASKIRTAIRLMDKVYDEDYGCEYQCQMREIYGDDVMKLKFTKCDDNPELSKMHYEYEVRDSADEIRKIESELFRKSQEKQKRAHKLLWDYIEHNIQGWWD